MYEAKTKETKTSFASYLATIDDPERRRDCKALAAIMKKVTGCAPKVWGTSIVGFDRYHYKYPSGHEGDSCIAGFASRKDALTLYLAPGFETTQKALLGKLGRHKTGKGCLYVKRLADVDLDVIEQLVTRSVTETRKRYPKPA